MHKTNDFYGHTAVLARYCGVPENTRLFGYLQHGWHESTGFPPDQFLLPATPKYVWSTPTKLAADAAGIRNVTPIGAPFVYLAELLDQASHPTFGAGYTLAFPFHGWAEADVAGDHESYARELIETEGRNLVVCLHINEFRVEEIRHVYEQHGLLVTSNGVQVDPAFLERQFQLLSGAERVVSNRMGTALWYAGFLKKPVHVYGQEMGVLTTREGKVARARHAEQWPELYTQRGSAEAAARYAAIHLGVGWRRSPEALRTLLRWDPPGRTQRLAIRMAMSASRLVAPTRIALRRYRRTSGL